MSETKTYAVTTATGRIGGRVARGLLAAGHQVRALGRSTERLQPLVDQGATPLVGDVRDASFVERAFEGADAAFLLVPGNRGARDFRRYFGDVGITYANAARATGLSDALFLSSIGTHDERYRGLVLVHADVEQALDAVAGLAVTHLRAPTFFENLFYFLREMRASSWLHCPIAPDTPIEAASTRDIADVALTVLLAEPRAGKGAMELHGPQGLTMQRISALIAEHLGRPFPAVQASRDEDIERLMRAGASRDFAIHMNDTWETFNRYGLLRATQPDPVRLAPTPIEDFIRDELVPAILAPAPSADPAPGRLAAAGAS